MRAAALAGALLCVADAAHALTPTAQDRHVFARHFFQPGAITIFETLSAADYAPFSASTNGAVPFFWPTLSSQESSIDPERLLASGSSLANPSQSGANQLHTIDSESVYAVDFVLDEERAFTLTGQLDLAVQDFGNVTQSCGTSEGHIVLSGPGGVVAEISGSQPPPDWNPPFPCTTACESSLPLAASGVLAPGSYQLEVRTDTAGQGIFAAHLKCNTSATGSYSVDLLLAPTVPALPLPLAPLLGVALLGAARAARRR